MGKPFKLTISSISDLNDVRCRQVQAAKRTNETLAGLLLEADFLSRCKFDPVGFDPWNPEQTMNLIEQINLDATYAVALDATEWLMQKHPSAQWQLSPGPRGKGPDIISSDGLIIAEAFAAVSRENNKKFGKDLARLLARKEPVKYLFYRTAEREQEKTFAVMGIEIIQLPRRTTSSASSRRSA